MKIEWNKVTWYSKLVAVVLFVGVFYLGFYIGGFVSSANQAVREFSDITPPGMEVIATALFTCKDGGALYATFRKGVVSLALSDGRNVTLPQTVSASGARYATPGDTFVFWNKGNTAFIDENGKRIYDNCTTKSH
jgi:membrane-bound inhibitor of C-type lysozyme